MKLLSMQSSPVPCYLAHRRSKYLPQHPFLKHPQHMFVPQCKRTEVLHPYKTKGKITVLNTFILIFLDSKLKDKRLLTEW